MREIIASVLEGYWLKMKYKASTLGQFLADLIERHEYTNRSLAVAAGVSESAVRNLLKVGGEPRAKEPDAKTLSLIAKALDVDPLRLFRLAGYIPPAPAAPSIRAEYLGEVFDTLPLEKQDAVLSVIEAMSDKPARKTAIQKMRADPDNPLAGMDLSLPNLSRVIANHLIAMYQMIEPSQVEVIEPNAQILQYKWKDLPVSTQERVKALIRHKLSLDYDATMVDAEWRR